MPQAGVRRALTWTGDPTKATVEIGRMVVEFKVLAALARFQALSRPAGGGGGRGGGAGGKP